MSSWLSSTQCSQRPIWSTNHWSKSWIFRKKLTMRVGFLINWETSAMYLCTTPWSLRNSFSRIFRLMVLSRSKSLFPKTVRKCRPRCSFYLSTKERKKMCWWSLGWSMGDSMGGIHLYCHIPLESITCCSRHPLNGIKFWISSHNLKNLRICPSSVTQSVIAKYSSLGVLSKQKGSKTLVEKPLKLHVLSRSNHVYSVE